MEYGSGCLMWIVWTERNRHSFEDTEKSLVQLQALFQKTLFDWSRCWGFSKCSTIFKSLFLLLVLLFKFFPVRCLLFVLFIAFPCVHHHEHPVLAFVCFLVCFNNFLITYPKKRYVLGLEKALGLISPVSSTRWLS